MIVKALRFASYVFEGSSDVKELTMSRSMLSSVFALAANSADKLMRDFPYTELTFGKFVKFEIGLAVYIAIFVG
jgi:hypothetical protein